VSGRLCRAYARDNADTIERSQISIPEGVRSPAFSAHDLSRAVSVKSCLCDNC
jgi:hypothetical protein